MKHIKTVFAGNSNERTHGIGCGECQTSCQSACKTSCTVANQSCEQISRDILQGNLHKNTDIRVRTGKNA